MNPLRRPTLAVTVVVFFLLAAACAPGGDAPSGPQTATTIAPESTTTSPFSADFRVEIGTVDRPGEFRATLRCGLGEEATGYLVDLSQQACDHLSTSDDARRLLQEGPAADRACTEIYGGGEIAQINGTLDGVAIDVAIDRTNGCGISDWALLQPILVQPYDLARQNAAADCSAAVAPTLARDQGELPPVVSEVRWAS